MSLEKVCKYLSKWKRSPYFGFEPDQIAEELGKNKAYKVLNRLVLQRDQEMSDFYKISEQNSSQEQSSDSNYLNSIKGPPSK